jgi:putative ABC transport system ATP-binding protein
MMALELERISQTRGSGRRAVQALRDVSLSIAAGEFVLLEGPSGAGKTTLLAVAAGLLTPTAGTVKLAGQSLGALSSAECRRQRAGCVGFVFQRSNLLPQLTLWDNVLLMVAIGGVPRTEGEGEATQLLQALGIAGLAQRYPRELSGGEEQRAAVARALVHRPTIVLADEPTGNLDGVSGKAVAERLAGLAAERGTAVLVATHDPRLEPFATRRVRIVDGTLADG